MNYSAGMGVVEDLSNSVDDYVKGCHIRGLPIGSVHGEYVN
jgi:hypothetical protein